MRQLEEVINKNGFTYHQVERFDHPSERSVAIYSQHNKGGTPGSLLYAYEVFIIPIRIKDLETPSGIIVPAGERFPGNEELASTVKGAVCSGPNAEKRAYEKAKELLKYLDDNAENIN